LKDKQLYKDTLINTQDKKISLDKNIRKFLDDKNQNNDDTRNSSGSSDITIKTTNSEEADFDATVEASHELFSKEPIEIGETHDEKVQNA
jgi:hypothetical protein